jgi:outer membrane protein
MKSKMILGLLMGILLSNITLAEEKNNTSFSLGVGGIKLESLYKTEDKYDNIPLVFVNVRYNNFYMNYDEVGYDIFNEDNSKLSLIGKVYRGYDSSDLEDEFSAMDDRDMDFHLGLKTSYVHDIYKFITYGTVDVSDNSNGKILGFEGSARLTILDRKLYFTPAIGAVYADKHFVNYFYGVTESEAVEGGINNGNEYSGEAEMTYGVKGILSYIYNSDISLQWINGVNFYGSNINKSPIVERDYSLYTGLMVTYKFM